MARRCIVLLIFLLSGCSSTPSSLEPVYTAPSAPTEKAIGSAVSELTSKAKLVSPVEVSEVRPNDRGPGSYFVCVKEANPPSGKPPRYYSAFFDNDTGKGWRLSVIMDQCELQTYGPAPAAAPATPSPPVVEAKPGKHKSRKHTEQD